MLNYSFRVLSNCSKAQDVTALPAGFTAFKHMGTWLLHRTKLYPLNFIPQIKSFTLKVLAFSDSDVSNLKQLNFSLGLKVNQSKLYLLKYPVRRIDAMVIKQVTIREKAQPMPP